MAPLHKFKDLMVSIRRAQWCSAIRQCHQAVPSVEHTVEHAMCIGERPEMERKEMVPSSKRPETDCRGLWKWLSDMAASTGPPAKYGRDSRPAASFRTSSAPALRVDKNGVSFVCDASDMGCGLGLRQ